MIGFVLPTSSRTQSLDRMPRSAVTLLLRSAVNARVSPLGENSIRASLGLVRCRRAFEYLERGVRTRRIFAIALETLAINMLQIPTPYKC